MNTPTERITYAISKCGKKASVLAAESGLSAARISQLAQGDGSLKAENLFLFARATGFSAQWLAEGIGDMYEADALAESHVLIPQFTAKGSAGSGHTNHHVEIRGGLMFKRDWLTRMGLREKNLKVIYCAGMSMFPTITDEDVLLIDEAQREPLNGRIYAIQRPDGDISIKRFVHTLTNGWIIRSDNEDKRAYPDENATDTDIGHLLIIGRAVWHAGAL
ncbi:LexA family transcriptional regulator [Pseudomonas synxantha]|uniref:LexA family transcriptional regulator n=1 Tax=Pseudomonas synxantha TaxID=47883 RepID=UPI00099B67BF|nr:LexA family transcriptional regulator [Pseudomonas synxantha]OPB08178.1 hypothetical protein BFW89_06600 [Pseudomonas synxantha]